MPAINNGGPAFPRPGDQYSQSDSQDGMSLRDYFAAQALAGYASRPLASFDTGQAPSYADVARWSYKQADAMLAERTKGGGA